MYALLRLGFTEEAAQFSGWLRDRVAEREGEALQLAPPLRFRSLPGALRVRTPLDARGASPAVLRPAGPWRTAKALVRVVGGRPGQ